LHRAIFGELVKVFVLSLVGITGIIVMATIVQQAMQRGLGPVQILTAIPLIIPSMLPFIIPPTTLFTACVVYGRLAGDNEITAIKSAGINVLYVIWPGILLGVLTSAVTMALYYNLIPYTQHLLRTTIVSNVEDFLYAMLKKDHEVRGRADLKLAYEIFVEQVQGKQLRNAIFKRRDATKLNYDIIAIARDAELRVIESKLEVEVHMRHGQVLENGGENRLHFEDRTFSVPMPNMPTDKFSQRDMTWQELLEARRKVAAKIQEYEATIAIVIANLNMSQPPKHLPQHLASLENIKRVEQQKLYSLNAELQMRPALSCGCLFFVLVGCPVGIWFSRSDYLSAFITCFLPIVFLYYPIQLCMTGLAKDGKMHPALALWAADTAMGLIALVLFRRLLKN